MAESRTPEATGGFGRRSNRSATDHQRGTAQEPASIRPSTDVALSVVIPTRNRRDSLLATLSSLLQQTADPACFEIVVVADGPADDTPDAVARLIESPEWADRSLSLITQPWGGAASARNTGLHAARGQAILFLDDDTVADPGLLTAHMSRQRSAPATGQVVLGHIAQRPGPGALHAALNSWWGDHYRRLIAREPGWNAFYTANVSVPRLAALAVGGFDPGLAHGEDVEFGYRLQLSGLPIVYADEAVVQTHNPKSPADLLADFERSGQGSLLIYRKSPGSGLGLPLAGYGQTSMRLRLVRAMLLRCDRLPGGARLLDRMFRRWARSDGQANRRPVFELARSYYFWRGVRAAATRSEWRHLASPGVPVLMYHSVTANADKDRYTTDPRRFARQMTLLRWARRRVLSLDELVDALDEGRPPPPRAVALTFDDGYRDNLTHAWPVLRRHGYPATLFLVTGHAGDRNAWDVARGRAARPLLTWDEVRRLDRDGFRVHSHTVSHRDLRGAEPSDVEFELDESRRRLEQELGHRPRLLAYPYGRHDAEADALAAAAGYQAGFSVRPGLNAWSTDRWDRPRIEICGSDNLVRFAMKVWLGDDVFRYLPKWVPALIRGPRS